MKDEMMAKIMDEVMKKMGGTEAPAQSMACEAPQGINEDLCGLDRKSTRLNSSHP